MSIFQKFYFLTVGLKIVWQIYKLLIFQKKTEPRKHRCRGKFKFNEAFLVAGATLYTTLCVYLCIYLSFPDFSKVSTKPLLWSSWCQVVHWYIEMQTAVDDWVYQCVANIQTLKYFERNIFIFVNVYHFSFPEYIRIFMRHLLTFRIYSDILSPCLLHSEYIHIFIRNFFWPNSFDGQLYELIHIYMKNIIKKFNI